MATNRHRDRPHRFRGFRPWWGIGYVGYPGGYVYTEPSRDQFGYFGAGGEALEAGREVIYDYDRSYPYDWYRAPSDKVIRTGTQSAYRCEMERVSGPDGQGSATVRVCRR